EAESTPGKIPYGARFRLKAGVDISAYSATAQIILTALKNYGAFLTDGGSNFAIQTNTDVTLDLGVMDALYDIFVGRPGDPFAGNVTTNDLEFVDEDSFQVSPVSGEVNSTNPYVTPDDFAVVLAKDVNDPNNSARISVPLQGVA